MGRSFSDRSAYLTGKPGARINGGGLLLGLVVYPVGLAFIRGGTAGMKAWFNAKFLNKVSTALPPVGPASPPSTGGMLNV